MQIGYSRHHVLLDARLDAADLRGDLHRASGHSRIRASP
jgi:hypothetical protein